MRLARLGGITSMKLDCSTLSAVPANRKSRLCPIRDPLSGTGCQEICQACLTDFMTRQSRIGKVYRLAGLVAGGTEAMPERAIADNLVLHFVVC